MTLQDASLLAITRQICIFDDLRYILSRWSVPVQVWRAETLEEIAQYHRKGGLDMILIDPFAGHRTNPVAFFKEVRQILGATPLVCLLPEDGREYRDAAIEMGANGMVALSRLGTDLLPLIQNLIASTSFIQQVNGRIQETARHTAPAGEAAQDVRAPESRLESRSDQVVAQLSSQITALTDLSAPAGRERRALHHLKPAPNLPGSPARARTVRTACNHDCGFHYCGMKVTLRDNHIAKIEPAEFSDPRYRSICQKGISYVQLVAQPKRLLYPLKRKGARGANQWERISWEQALQEIGQKIQATTAQYGPESTMFLTSKGQAGILNGYFGVYYRLASVLGASAVDPRKLGMDTGVASGVEDTFGLDTGFQSNAFEDLANSKMILVWGSNPVSSWMPWWSFFLEAKKAGAHLVTVDPLFTATAAKSDTWLPIRPGTDLFLALGMIHLIIDQGWFAADYVLAHTVGPFLVREDTGHFLRVRSDESACLVWDEAAGTARPASAAERPALRGRYTVNGVTCRPAFDLLAEYVQEFTPERVAKKTGLAVEQIVGLAQRYAATRPARIFTTFGIERWGHAATFGRLISTLGALTGNIGIPGGGAGVTGFFEFPLHIGRFAYPEGRHFRPVNPAELPEYIVQGSPYPIKAVMVAFSNWFNHNADWSYMQNTVLPNLDLLVVSELFMTETARWADYVLPAASLFEREDMVKGPGPYVQYQPQILPLPGECRSDMEIAAGIGRQLGLARYFSEPPATYLRQELGEIDPRLGAQAFARLQREGVLQRVLPPEALIAHANGTFATPSGRAEFYVERLLPYGKGLPVYQAPIEADLDGETARQYPLVCIFVHSQYRVNSTFDQASWLQELDPEPFACLNPDTARARQIGELEWVRVHNQRGYVEMKAHLTASVPPGVVHLTSGWQADRFRAGHPQTLTHRIMDSSNALGASMAFSDTLVEVSRAENAGGPA